MSNDPILENLLELKESVGGINERLDRLHAAIDGNGQPGLQQRVQSLEQARSKLTGIAFGIGAVWTGLITLIEYLFQHRAR